MPGHICGSHITRNPPRCNMLLLAGPCSPNSRAADMEIYHQTTIKVFTSGCKSWSWCAVCEEWKGALGSRAPWHCATLPSSHPKIRAGEVQGWESAPALRICSSLEAPWLLHKLQNHLNEARICSAGFVIPPRPGLCLCSHIQIYFLT